jgi:hypothetical protein
MPANLPMPKPPEMFSPWRKTGHFLLLMAALDVIIVIVIIIIAPHRTPLCDRNILRACESITVVTPNRVMMLLNVNIGLISLYAGLISFLHKRPAAKLVGLALVLFVISLFVGASS